MKSFIAKPLLAASLVCTFPAFAGDPPPCDPKYDPYCEPPPPPKGPLCHNIGGPQQLGANCDNANASLLPCALLANPLAYAGIVISPNDASFDAHLRHGDGFALVIFSPPLHLASEGQNHQAANVECVAIRAITTQPPEPGN
jgi:hypothetical protein